MGGGLARAIALPLAKRRWFHLRGVISCACFFCAVTFYCAARVFNARSFITIGDMRGEKCYIKAILCDRLSVSLIFSCR